MLRAADLEYELPEGLIATQPAEPRESARLMVVLPDRIEHARVGDLPGLLEAGDALIMNATRVLPARFVGRAETGGRAEGLWLGEVEGESLVWCVYIRMRRLKSGKRAELFDRAGNESGIGLKLIDRAGDDGAWLVQVDGASTTMEALSRVGLTPLPPYIRGARAKRGVAVSEDADREAYQTGVAGDVGRGPMLGSVAAPTAGLHFSPDLLAKLDGRGVRRGQVLLHVGAGTFKPIETEFVEQHQMHREWCSLDDAGWALDHPGRVVAVGSTSARTLESFALRRERGEALDPWVDTDLLIAPGYEWRRVGAMLTNFHLPRSTLLAMVASFMPGGLERVREAYRLAIEHEYRFYSFGDAMLIVPESGCAPKRGKADG